MVSNPEAAQFSHRNSAQPGFILHSHIIAKGCSPALIRRFLGKADSIQTSAAGNCLQRLYLRDRVEQVFATPEARAAMQESTRRRDLIRKTRREKGQSIFRQIEQLPIAVQAMNPAQLRLAGYRWLKLHVEHCVNTCHSPEYFLSERHLARRSYLFARHRLCGFENATALIKGSGPLSKHERRLVELFNRQIVARFPQVAWPASQAANEPVFSCVALAVVQSQDAKPGLDFDACQGVPR